MWALAVCVLLLRLEKYTSLAASKFQMKIFALLPNMRANFLISIGVCLFNPPLL